MELEPWIHRLAAIALPLSYQPSYKKQVQSDELMIIKGDYPFSTMCIMDTTKKIYYIYSKQVHMKY